MSVTAVPPGALPPQNLDAEGVVLSQSMLDETGIVLDEVRGILGSDGSMFYADANRHIYEALCQLRDAGSALTAVTIAHCLRDNGRLGRVGDVPYISQLIDTTPVRLAVTEHATIVRDMARLRQAIHVADRLRAEAYVNRMPEGGVQSFLLEYEQALADVAHSAAVRHLVPLGDVLRTEVHPGVMAALENGSALNGIATGFENLDAMTTGMHPGDFRVIAGRPGMGKTGLMLNETQNVAAQGYAAPFFSLEMPAKQLALRLVSQEAKIDLKVLRGGRIASKDFTRYTAAMQKLSELPIFIDDTAELTVFEMRARVKRLQLECAVGKHPLVTKMKVGGVWADYIQLFKGTGQNREQEIASIARDMKKTAKLLGVSVTSGAQLNRGVENRKDKEPVISDLRESGAIEQDADLVMLLHRPSNYSPEDPELQGWADVIIGKQRNGPTGKRRLGFIAEFATFTNLARGYEEFDSVGDPYAGDPYAP